MAVTRQEAEARAASTAATLGLVILVVVVIHLIFVGQVLAALCVVGGVYGLVWEKLPWH